VVVGCLSLLDRRLLEIPKSLPLTSRSTWIDSTHHSSLLSPLHILNHVLDLLLFRLTSRNGRGARHPRTIATRPCAAPRRLRVTEAYEAPSLPVGTRRARPIEKMPHCDRGRVLPCRTASCLRSAAIHLQDKPWLGTIATLLRSTSEIATRPIAKMPLRTGNDSALLRRSLSWFTAC
jgi:hypothetical protein